jgi:hypothetical protein
MGSLLEELPKEAALEIVTASGRNSEYGKKSRAEFAAGMSSARFGHLRERFQ